MDAKLSHTSEPLVSLKDDPSFSFCGLKGGGGRICRTHENFWYGILKGILFPKIEGSVFFPKELRSGFF